MSRERTGRALALLALALPLPARADNVDATMTTLVQGFQDLRDGQVHSVVPIIELVSVRGTDIQNSAVDDLSFVLSGWGALQLGDQFQFADPGSGGDLDLAYVQGSEFDKHLDFRVGRQLVTGGSAQVLPIDGADVTVTPVKDFGLTAYGGAIVVPRFAVAEGDAAAGARAFWRPSLTSEVGASFVDVLDQGLVARQEAGLDAHVVPLQALTLTAYALLSTIDDRLAEGELSATWQPLPSLELTGEYRRTAPDLFISAASIFSVFAEERQDEVGGSGSWRISRWFAVDGDFYGIGTEEGWGHRGRARVKLTAGPTTTVGLEGRELLLQLAPAYGVTGFIPVTEAGENGYYAADLFGTCHFSPALLAALDLEDYRFRAPVNGQSESYDGTISVVYDVSKLWQVSLAGVEAVTPLVAPNTEVIARVVFNPTVSFREHK